MQSNVSRIEVQMLALGSSLIRANHNDSAQIVAEALAEIIRLREEIRSLRASAGKSSKRSN
jgi:aromatic ring hydroxylase